MYQNTHHHMWWVKARPAQDQRCQSGPSARNSFVPSEGRFSKNYGADQQRLQISDPHFDKFHVSNVRLLEDEVQAWGMYLLTISYGSYAVDQRSGDGWISGWLKKRSVRLTPARNCPPMSCRQVARPCSKGPIRACLRNWRCWLLSGWRSRWLLHQSECSRYGLEDPSCVLSARPSEFVFFFRGRSCRQQDCFSAFASRHWHCAAFLVNCITVSKKKKNTGEQRSTCVV